MPSIREEITRTLVRFGRRSPEGSVPGMVWLREKADVGQYRVVRQLGAGGMGQVYLALDTNLGRHVALKVLSPQLTSDPAHVARFKQEAQAASALNHPNILTIYDFCDLDGAQVIVSEFVDGRTLRTVLERELIDRAQAIDITMQVASALAAAHAAGVIHRDLKPTNIMLRPDGYAKIIDFGLAKLAERSGRANSEQLTLTRPGTIVGTLRYMSPEQARGEEVDHRGDIWSLGVVLYEMLAGHPPFEGITDNHLAVAISDAVPKPLPTDRDLPSELDSILKRALAKNRKDRYQSARDFQADLQAVQPVGVPGSTVRLRRRPPSALRPWILSALLGIVLAAFFWWARSRFAGPDWFSVSQTERLTFEGDVQQAALSSSGRWLAYANGAEGKEVLHLRALYGGQDRTLPPTEETYSGLTFSPDEKTLFLVLRDTRGEFGTLFSVPVDDFGRTPEALRLRDVDGPVAFSPDGKSFAFVRRKEMDAADVSSVWVAPLSDVHREHEIVSLRQGQMYGELTWSKNGIGAVVFPLRLERTSAPAVYVFNPEGRLLSQTESARFRDLQTPVFTPDGRSVILAAKTQGSAVLRLEQLSLRTGEWHTVAADLAGYRSPSLSADGSLLAAVRSSSGASVWVADKNQLGNAKRLTPETEDYTSLAWTGGGDLIVPSTRTGNENLTVLTAEGQMRPFGKPREALETYPATAAGTDEVAYTSNAAHGGNEFNIWKVQPGKSEPVPLTGGSNVDVTPQVTPDGKWVLYSSFVAGGQTLWKVPITGGRPNSVSRLRVRSPFIAPDGQSIVCEIREPHTDWRVAILSFPGGELIRELPSLPIGGVVRWSPDGSALDYLARQNGASLILRQPLTGGAARVLVTVPELSLVYFAWSQDGSRLAFIVGRVETDVVLLRRSSRN